MAEEIDGALAGADLGFAHVVRGDGNTVVFKGPDSERLALEYQMSLASQPGVALGRYVETRVERLDLAPGDVLAVRSDVANLWTPEQIDNFQRWLESRLEAVRVMVFPLRTELEIERGRRIAAGR